MELLQIAGLTLSEIRARPAASCHICDTRMLHSRLLRLQHPDERKTTPCTQIGVTLYQRRLRVASSSGRCNSIAVETSRAPFDSVSIRFSSSTSGERILAVELQCEIELQGARSVFGTSIVRLRRRFSKEGTMSCCGKARARVQQTIMRRTTGAVSGAAPVPVEVPSGPSAAASAVYFRYYGNTGLTVAGPASSRVYRFVANGAAVAVDPRDAPSLSRVSNLRVVRQA